MGIGAAAGAAGSYFLDPAHGRRRRALVRDKARHLLAIGRRFAHKLGADVVHRLRGVAATKNPLHHWSDRRAALFKQNWSPVARTFGALAGTAGAFAGLRRGGLLGGLATALGSLLVARSATDLTVPRLVGVGAGRRAIDLQKHINVSKPREQVFAFFRNFENLPRFMSHLRGVTARGDRSHWVAIGPAGISVSWEAQITQLEPSHLIAWQSVPGSIVRSSGVVRFEPDGKGGTDVHVQMSYNPPLGAVGHAVAFAFGVDPKKSMDDDLLRLKSLLETGRATAHHRTVTRWDFDGPTAS